MRTTARLPLPVVHLLGSTLGRLFYLIPCEPARITITNIRHCFPELSSPAQKRLARKSLVETGKALLESGVFWLRPGPQALTLIREVRGSQLVEEALRGGRGVILLTPHLGAWEAAGLYGADTFRMSCLYRPLRIPELEETVRRARSRLGACYVPATTAGIRTIMRRLRQGATIAMLPDQEPRWGRGIYAPFFGVPALTTSLPVRLAERTGAPIVLAWCERLARGRGYCLHFSRPPAGIHADDVEYAVGCMNAAIETLVRSCPSQYQWSYRRFRCRPQDLPSIYTASRKDVHATNHGAST